MVQTSAGFKQQAIDKYRRYMRVSLSVATQLPNYCGMHVPWYANQSCCLVIGGDGRWDEKVLLPDLSSDCLVPADWHANRHTIALSTWCIVHQSTAGRGQYSSMLQKYFDIDINIDYQNSTNLYCVMHLYICILICILIYRYAIVFMYFFTNNVRALVFYVEFIK